MMNALQGIPEIVRYALEQAAIKAHKSASQLAQEVAKAYDIDQKIKDGLIYGPEELERVEAEFENGDGVREYDNVEDLIAELKAL